MSKKLLNLILGFVFTSTLAFSQQQDYPRYSQQDLLVYKKVKEDIEKADTLDSKPFVLSRIGLVNMYSYDFNKDSVIDASEIYTLEYSDSTGRLEPSKNPLFYLFDLNNDGVIEYKEFVMDKEKDGLNGNEEFSNFLRPKKQKVTKWEL